jgi:hypothetical protein
MDYNQPYGGATGAPYVNGNPATGTAGSIPPAAAIEYPQREIVDTITKAGLTPSNADLGQLAKAIQSGAMVDGADTGTANALVVTLAPTPSDYPKFLFIKKGANANGGATTIEINTLAVVGVKSAGADLSSGVWGANAIGLLAWDGAAYELLAVSASSGGGSSGLSGVDNSSAPIFPEIIGTSSNPNDYSANVLAFTGSVGQVVVNSGKSWQWRGLKLFSSASFAAADRTFATAASKTYHLRWNAPGTGAATPAASYPNGRFVLKDLADAAYNPSSLSENHYTLDTQYDDMLCARVVTDAGNNPTITALANKARLCGNVTFDSGGVTRTSDANAFIAVVFNQFTLNWSRNPVVAGNGSGYLGQYYGSKTMWGGPSSPVSATDGTGTVSYGCDRYQYRPLMQIKVATASTSGTVAGWCSSVSIA